MKSFLIRIRSNQEFKTAALFVAFILLIYFSSKLFEKYFEVEKIGHKYEKNNYSAKYFVNLYPELHNQTYIADEMPLISETEKQKAVGLIVRDCDESICPLYRLISAELDNGKNIIFQGETGEGAVECYLDESLDFKSKDVCLDTNGKGWGIQLVDIAE